MERAGSQTTPKWSNCYEKATRKCRNGYERVQQAKAAEARTACVDTPAAPRELLDLQYTMEAKLPAPLSRPLCGRDTKCPGHTQTLHSSGLDSASLRDPFASMGHWCSLHRHRNGLKGFAQQGAEYARCHRQQKSTRAPCGTDWRSI